MHDTFVRGRDSYLTAVRALCCSSTVFYLVQYKYLVDKMLLVGMHRGLSRVSLCRSSNEHASLLGTIKFVFSFFALFAEENLVDLRGFTSQNRDMIIRDARNFHYLEIFIMHLHHS